ncbi:hypothetical protein H072_1055 [Dactylellina haptotyla CBS 200.50]|uniref:MARVEL domain-containing protein n=1 Tax=Dactylellina haptotyla (strain CBS 200.50) TaxID=1284197 RepID=S8APW9_DACHA|nr:hypothetical protein H072_1055 [Dactylellina haptotyla CBS 200.50]
MSGYDALGQDPTATYVQTTDLGYDPKQDIKDVEKAAALAKKLGKSQKRVFNLQVFERVVNLMASLAVGGIMAFTLDQFIVNQHQQVNGTGPFGSNPKLWPTYVMAGVAGVTLIFNTCVLLAYCCGRKAADRVASGSSYIKLLSPIGHLIVWGTTAGSFKVAASGKDIWTFACSKDPSVVAIQRNFENKIDYDMICQTNTGSWYTSIATAGFAVIGIIIWIFITIHTRKQKSMQKKLAAANGYENYRTSYSQYGQKS